MSISAPQRAAVSREQPAGMPVDIMEALDGRSLAVLASVSPAGAPTTTPVSWIVAGAGKRLAVALDRRASAFDNIGGEPRVAVEVFAGGAAYVLRGRARIVTELLSQAPFPCAAAVIDVDEIRSHRLPSVAIGPPSYCYWPAKAHYRKTEQAVIAFLRSLLDSVGCSQVT